MASEAAPTIDLARIREDRLMRAISAAMLAGWRNPPPDLPPRR